MVMACRARYSDMGFGRDDFHSLGYRIMIPRTNIIRAMNADEIRMQPM